MIEKQRLLGRPWGRLCESGGQRWWKWCPWLLLGGCRVRGGGRYIYICKQRCLVDLCNYSRSPDQHAVLDYEWVRRKLEVFRELAPPMKCGGGGGKSGAVPLARCVCYG